MRSPSPRIRHSLLTPFADQPDNAEAAFAEDSHYLVLGGVHAPEPLSSQRLRLHDPDLPQVLRLSTTPPLSLPSTLVVGEPHREKLAFQIATTDRTRRHSIGHQCFEVRLEKDLCRGCILGRRD